MGIGSSLTFEKEMLARHGLAITTTDMRGVVNVKIFEGNKELTRWLELAEFREWVQGFIYAMRRKEVEKPGHNQ